MVKNHLSPWFAIAGLGLENQRVGFAVLQHLNFLSTLPGPVMPIGPRT